MVTETVNLNRGEGSLHDKLLHSHLTVASLGFVLLCAAFFLIWILGANAHRLASDVGPTAQASLRALSGIHSSIAATRGWVTLGDPVFRDERKQAWEEEIFPAISKLKKHLADSTETYGQDNLEGIIASLKDLEESQWWIEDIAQTPGNDQARYYFIENIIPVSDAVLNAISGLLTLTPDAQDSNTLDLRNALISLQYQFTSSVSALKYFLDSAESLYAEKFQASLLQGLVALGKINMSTHQLSEEQLELFHLIRVEQTPFEKFGNELINIRKKGTWNVAQNLLAMEAVPLARELIDDLTIMSDEHSRIMHKKTEQIRTMTQITIPVTIMLILLLIVSTSAISRRSTARLVQPIATLTNAAEKMANGEIDIAIEIEGNDELAMLGETFNAMHYSIQEKTLSLKRTMEDLEFRVTQRTQELALSRELAETTLNSIGDAVISTDQHANIRMMNPVAEVLTGWKFTDVVGKQLSDVFQIVNEQTQLSVESPVKRCLESKKVVLLEKNCNLIRQDGSQTPVNDSAAPIQNQEGETVGAVLVFRDVSRERSLHRKLSYQATHDALTGLINRAEYERRLESALIFARNENRVHTVAFIDLDKFKIINDTCGHAAGDDLLCQITKIIAQPVRAHDTVARLGGDEFALLLEDCNIDNAIKVCESIRKDIKSFHFEWQGDVFSVGVSMGLMPVDENSQSVAEVIKHADTACYASKEAGRNRVTVFKQENEDTACPTE
ncbi:MAG: diguanylate cyclase [Gammaproteobacteria bacterium]